MVATQVVRSRALISGLSASWSTAAESGGVVVSTFLIASAVAPPISAAMDCNCARRPSSSITGNW